MSSVAVRQTLVLLLAAAVVATIARRVDPVDSAIEPVAAMVTSIARDGDLVILVGRDRQFDVAAFDGVPAIATDRVPLEIGRFDRLIVVRAAEATESIVRTLRRDTRELLHTTVAGFDVSVFEVTEREFVVADLVETLDRARVEIDYDAEGSADISCTASGPTHRCGLPEWIDVRTRVENFAGQPQTCVWTHPVDDATVRIEFDGIRGATHLSGWFGITDYGASIPDGARVSLVTRAGNSTERHGVQNTKGRRPFEHDLPEDFDGTVIFEVDAPRAGVRHFCWDVQAVRRERGS